MIDPLAEIVTLLQPSAKFSKLVEGAGQWSISGQASGEPFYCALLEGRCRLGVDGQPPITLEPGDFVLVPAMHQLVNSSMEADADTCATMPLQVAEGHFRIGRPHGPAELRMQIGHCRFGSLDSALLVPLLPRVIHVRGMPRLAALVQLVADEARARRPAREPVLQRLLEVLLIEALRCSAGPADAPGLVRGLADERLATALRALHARPGHPWTVVELAAEAALSRSAFFQRFSRTVGVAPMEYLLVWRMALARQLLREPNLGLEQVAERVGYRSAATFSVAFARQVGQSPARYVRSLREPLPSAIHQGP